MKTNVLGHELAQQARARWRSGEAADARAFLAGRPDLSICKSIVLDVAYEEYCYRRDAGERVDHSAFCARFPSYRRSLHRLLDVHDTLHQELWPQPADELCGMTVLRELGRGAMGRVYHAARGERQFAVKASYHRSGEAEILGKLEHSHIVAIEELHDDEETGLSLVCMPYLGQATLHDVIDHCFRDGAPESSRAIAKAVADINGTRGTDDAPQARPAARRYVDAAAAVGAQLADALAHAHARGIWHLDLKPSNVLLTPEGVPQLLDFGLSRDLFPADDAGQHRAGGTLPYMPPEQIRWACALAPGSEAVGERSDVFSLGVILYEMLTGELPWGEVPRDMPLADQAQLLLQRQLQTPPRADDFNPQVGRGLAALLRRCLSLDPKGRPSARGLARALRQQSTWRGRLAGGLPVLLGGVVIALVAGSFALAPEPPGQPHEKSAVERAVAQCAKGDRAAALRTIDQGLLEEPDSPQLLFARARLRQASGDLRGAIGDYDRVWKHTRNPLMLDCIGACYARFGDYAAARTAYRQAADHGYVSAAMCNNLGVMLQREGLRHDAVATLDFSIDLKPMPQPYANRAVASLNQVLSRQAALVPAAAAADVDAAVALEQGSEELLVLAAKIHVWRAVDRTTTPPNTTFADLPVRHPLHLEIALGYLKAAHKSGFVAAGRDLQRHPELLALSCFPEFESLQAPAAVVPKHRKVLPWADPVPGLALPRRK